jgi:hypothetical protein
VHRPVTVQFKVFEKSARLKEQPRTQRIILKAPAENASTTPIEFHRPSSPHDADFPPAPFAANASTDCGTVTALSSSAAEDGSAIAIVPVAASATIVDKNQKKTFIAAPRRKARLNRRS